MKIDISVARATEMESMKCMEKERNYCGKDIREIREPGRYFPELGRK